ncbi:hypothetical protein CDN99_17280 [Roseateles aquatilis]|uniref:Uncharacterized protein n=1 Tax=Roseateles aquatilis TaxID=431061 RepID=A0A246J7T7_9BURK|nr:hypothetical protein CDN99_17280 [Roseateles aquatilis]
MTGEPTATKESVDYMTVDFAKTALFRGTSVLRAALEPAILDFVNSNPANPGGLGQTGSFRDRDEAIRGLAAALSGDTFRKAARTLYDAFAQKPTTVQCEKFVADVVRDVFKRLDPAQKARLAELTEDFESLQRIVRSERIGNLAGLTRLTVLMGLRDLSAAEVNLRQAMKDMGEVAHAAVLMFPSRRPAGLGKIFKSNDSYGAGAAVRELLRRLHWPSFTSSATRLTQSLSLLGADSRSVQSMLRDDVESAFRGLTSQGQALFKKHAAKPYLKQALLNEAARRDNSGASTVRHMLLEAIVRTASNASHA